MNYAIIWFVFWAVLWTAYLALDGFDLGVGFSGWLAAKDDQERSAVFSTIAPFWDGNEVWLVTAGGATFAAFPPVYAALFSWLYPALFLLLFSLIFRGVALEFRGKVDSPAWRAAWARTAAVSSFLAALLLGVALGNIFRGLPIGPDGYEGTFLGLLNPYALLSGLTYCALFFYHGQLWLSFKASSEAVAGRAAALASSSWYAAALLCAALQAAGLRAAGPSACPFARLVLPGLVIVLLGLSKALLSKGRFSGAFGASFAAVALTALAGFASIYPALLPSRVSPEFALTLFNSSSSPYTLKLMTAVVLVFLPVVIGYQAWVYRVFRAPLSPQELKRSGMY